MTLSDHYRRWQMRTKGDMFVSSGIGPFSRRTLEGIRDGMCSLCGVPISESTLFGNALTLSDGEVHCWCSNCRAGFEHKLYPDHPFYHSGRGGETNNTIDRLLVIGEIGSFMASQNLGLSWLDVVLCLRTGVGDFQKSSYRKPFQGLSSDQARQARERYGRLLPGSCAECGALWANKYEIQVKRMTKADLVRERTWSETHCWACGFPHQLQWFMRTSYEEEQEQIFRRTESGGSAQPRGLKRTPDGAA